MDTQISNFLKILKSVFDNQNALLLEKPVEWEFLSKTARKQNLLPLFFEAVSVREDYRNSDVFEKDQMDTFTMVAAQIQRSNAFLEIYKRFTDQGIFPIVIKGIVCRQLYGNLGEHRPSSDEDLLIEIKDFPKVKEILEEENYICRIPDVTERTLKQIQEVSFYHPEKKLHLEVHTNIIGKESKERTRMNSLFQEVHHHGQMIQIDGVDIKVMEATDSLLFLVLHAYKHFRGRGVGIRQVMDILLYYKTYRQEIVLKEFQKALNTCRAENFWRDLLYIGNQHLGLCEEEPEECCSPEELMRDMMHAGVFGGQEKSDSTAARINLMLEGSGRRQDSFNALFRAAFPPKQVLLAGYPSLEDYPWIMPVIWVKRWIKFLRYTGKDVWKVSKEILEKSSARMELIKKYEK